MRANFFWSSSSSVPGPILFNTFISGLVLILKDIDIASYADGNTLYKAC